MVFSLLALGLAACSSYGKYADSDTEAATDQSTVLPTVTSEPAEPAPQAEEAESAPSTIDNVAGEETTAQDHGQRSANDDEVARANRWNGSDLDCSDFTITDIPITGSDPNGLDREGDGIGCES